MIKLVSYYAKDFLSFQDFSYTMKEKPINVQGINSTDDDKESNGSGKSSVMTVIEYGTKGTNSRKSKDKELIRRGGSKKAEVGVTYYCGTRNERLEIHREIPSRGSTKLSILINEVAHDFSTVKDGNKFILEWLDTSADDFMSYYLINSERFKSFFASSNTERLALIARLQGTENVSEWEQKVKADVAVKDEQVKEIDKGVSRIEGEIISIERQIENLKSVELSATVEDRVNKILESIDKNWEDVAKKEADVLEIRTTILEKQKEVEQLESDIEVYAKSIPDSKVLSDELSLLRKEQNTINNELALCNKRIAGSIDCPKCSHKFVLGEDVDLDDEQGIADELKVLSSETAADIGSLQEELTSIDKMNAELTKKRAVLARLNMSVNTQSSSVQKIEASIATLKSNNEILANKAEAISQEDSADNTKQIAMLEGDLDNANTRLKKQLSELSEAETERDLAAEWITNFKRFKIFLANKVTNKMQSLCNEQLMKMKSNLRVKIEGFKVLAKGDVKEEITPLVVEDEPANFYSYSGGEKARVQFAMILATQEMINAKNKWGGINLLCMDEVLEGLDPLGLSLLMKSIKNLGMSVMIITHVTDRKIHEDTLVIEKVNGISQIKENE